jgi:hypothetical protein
MQKAETIKTAPIQRALSIGKTLFDINNCIKGESTDQLHAFFNEKFSHIDHIISDEHDEAFILDKDPYHVIKPAIAKKLF